MPFNRMVLDYEGKGYDLFEVRLHTPSEHTIDGQLHDAELQLIHRSKAGSLLIVSLMIWEGGKNTKIKPLVEKLPLQTGTLERIASLNLQNLLPKVKSYFHYSGSLTTPPCTEGVAWLVLTRSIQFSARQLDQLELTHGKNNRPLQPLGKRLVMKSRY